MRTATGILVLLASTAAAGQTPEPTLAYQADVVMTYKGETSRTRIYSDGIRRKTQSSGKDGQTSGTYTDSQKKLSWNWGPGYGCIQMPQHPAGATSKEEPAGTETIDGHPTKKFKVTSSATIGGKPMTAVEYVWKATDLQDLVIQRKSEDDSTVVNVRNIVLGKPDEKLLTFPSPPCKYDEALDTTRYAPETPGGFRTVSFSDASCKKLVPLPLTLSIPSDYEIRQGGHMGCFWGATDDLSRVLKTKDEADFAGIKRGVYWCRVSNSTEYDPMRKRFVNEHGTDDQWAGTLAREGLRDVVMTPKTVGSIPTLRITGAMKGLKVYMLYIGVGDSPAILINYRPAGKGGPADDAAWQQFLDSLHAAP